MIRGIMSPGQIIPGQMVPGQIIPGDSGPAYYRSRAGSMKNRARLASGIERRAAYLELAAYWTRLAEKAEELPALKPLPATA